MFKKLDFSLLIVFLISVSFSTYAQDDVEGSKDHPIISRYEGSYIKGYEHYDYDRLTFYTGEENGELQEIVPEGEVTQILYFLPTEGLSVLQVQRNYQMALKEAGFEIVYECLSDKNEIPYSIFEGMLGDHYSGDHSKNVFIGKDKSYFLARLPQDDGNMYISAHTLLSEYADEDNQPVTLLQILEEKPMATGKVQVEINADAMAQDIDEKGSVRIYGIHFETDKATIKEKSKSTLAEIASLLEQKPELNLGVIGHTDATGGMEHNMDLSVQRAEAVVASLATNYGISEERLTPYGVGPLAPVASNDDEDGRARNRRVELIKLPEQ
ncbi:OmpA family protein [Tangfeifania diversioriginum]|uniref:OmpA family protein n=1 Tax=Tangfeifania diversioriginum TaxID=1168035 RepID=A0A1M6IZR3_9BACT|nr:OmpA family protein [Tangfeifania diversioriginum]SHJ39832.1 OmpA family protein [Tangfeifania diversioriginum]